MNQSQQILERNRIVGKFIKDASLFCGNDCFNSFESAKMSQQEKQCFVACFDLQVKLRQAAEEMVAQGVAKYDKQ